MSFNLRKNLYCPAKAKEFYEGEEAESSKQVIYALVIKYFAHRKLKTSVCTCTDQHNIVLPAKKKKKIEKKEYLGSLIVGFYSENLRKVLLGFSIKPLSLMSYGPPQESYKFKAKEKEKTCTKTCTNTDDLCFKLYVTCPGQNTETRQLYVLVC